MSSDAFHFVMRRNLQEPYFNMYKMLQSPKKLFSMDYTLLGECLIAVKQLLKEVIFEVSSHQQAIKCICHMPTVPENNSEH